ncbi:hypothetical protein OA340_02420, partial [Paracoccaceae bacterium]|nr:hypothetical protein [Paracoccaceae bacterium]
MKTPLMVQEIVRINYILRTDLYLLKIKFIWTSVLFFLLILIASSVSASNVSARPPISSAELIDYLDGKEHWYGVYIATKKLGYAYEKWQKEFYAGKPIFKGSVGFALNTDYFKIFFEEHSTFSLEDNQTLIKKIVNEKSYDYDEDGHEIGSLEKDTYVTMEGENYVIRTTKNKDESEIKIPFFPINLKKYHFDIFSLGEDFANEIGREKFVSGIDLGSNKPEYSIIKEISRNSILKEDKLIPKTSILLAQALNTELETEALVEFQGLEVVRFEMLGNFSAVREPKEKAIHPGDTLKLKDIESYA